MTLVLSLITESWAIQVSDRKQVWQRADGEIVREDDNENKAVLWCNRLAFAYAGLGELGPKREATDEWLSRELAEWWVEAGEIEQGQDAVVAAIAERATVAINRAPLVASIPAHQRRHAFVGVGWARFDQRGGMVPYIVQIHNHPTSTDLAAPAEEEFGSAILRLPEDRNIFVNWMGQELQDREKVLLEELKRGDPSSRAYGEHAVGVMVSIVRSVAERNEFVGRGLLVNCLPCWAIRPGDTSAFLIASGPLAENLTFLYLPADSDDLVVPDDGSLLSQVHSHQHSIPPAPSI